MQTVSALTGTRSPSSKTMARFPSNVKVPGKAAWKLSTRLVRQWKYMAYCVGSFRRRSIRIVLPLPVVVTYAGSPHRSVSSSRPTSRRAAVSKISWRSRINRRRMGAG